MKVSHGLLFGLSLALADSWLWFGCFSGDVPKETAGDGGADAKVTAPPGKTTGGTTTTGTGTGTGTGMDATTGTGTGTGGDPDAGDTTDAGSGGNPTDDGGGMTEDGGGGAMDAGASDDGGDIGDSAVAVMCNRYCNAVISICNGAQQQYPSQRACREACSFLPLGTVNDTTGNTVGCRLHETVLAAADPAHCVAAGAYGGGVCGDRCDPFCAVAVGACPQDAGPEAAANYVGAGYIDQPSCVVTCTGFVGADGGMPPDGGETDNNPAAGDTLYCRESRLLQALDMPVPRCRQPAAMSNTCR